VTIKIQKTKPNIITLVERLHLITNLALQVTDLLVLYAAKTTRKTIVVNTKKLAIILEVNLKVVTLRVKAKTRLMKAQMKRLIESQIKKGINQSITCH
jgi:hypothetical protein